MQRTIEAIESRPLHTTVMALDGHIGGRIRQHTAKHSFNISCADDRGLDACQLRKHAHFQIGRGKFCCQRPASQPGTAGQGHQPRRPLTGRELIDIHHLICQPEVERHIVDIVAAHGALFHSTSQLYLRIAQRTAYISGTVDPSLQQIILLIGQRRYRIGICIIDLQLACYLFSSRIDRAGNLIRAAILFKAELIEVSNLTPVLDQTAQIRDFLLIQHQARCLEDTIKLRAVRRAQDLALESSMTAYLIGQLVLHALQIDVPGFYLHIEMLRLVDRAVEHHINHRRIRMEILQADHAIIQEIVTVHA